MASGGSVSCDRVNGQLAVSRSLGDFSFKRNKAIPAEAQAVSARPDVTVLPRSATDRFVVLACDGVWDVFSNDGCAKFLLDSVVAGMATAQELTEALVDEALNKGSMDNISAFVLALPGAPTPTPYVSPLHVCAVLCFAVRACASVRLLPCLLCVCLFSWFDSASLSWVSFALVLSWLRMPWWCVVTQRGGGEAERGA